MTDQSAPHDDLVGQTLAGRYRITALLGVGAMGAVYLGEHVKIGRRDALKVLRPELARDPESVARFLRGARNVSAIRHPNVCTIYDFSDTQDGLQFCAMEYVDGETLKDVLDRDGRMEPARAMRIAHHVADALQAAHDAGIVHRDLKPGNIMLGRAPDGSDTVKVVDFDIAKGPTEAAGEEVTRLGFVVGTPEYMSPEQLMGERIDGRSDVYALAIVLFRMLTGLLPFRATTTQERMVERLTADPLTLSEVADAAFPPGLEAIIVHALQRRADDRHASAADFARDLDRLLAGAPSSAELVPPTTLSPVTSPRAHEARTRDARPTTSRSPRRVLVVAALALLVTVAGGAGLVMLNRGATDANPPEAQPEDAAAQTSQADAAADTTPDAGDGRAVDESSPDAASSQTEDVAQRATDSDGTDIAATAAADRARRELLDRQVAQMLNLPSAATLHAIRDTAEYLWGAATTRADSVDVALLLAQVALSLDDRPTCLRWARIGSSFGESSFDMLLDTCR